MSIVLNFYKIIDDMHDEAFSKSVFLYPMYKSALKKTLCDNQDKKYIEEMLARLSRLENLHCDEPDIVSDAFACIMQKIFGKYEALSKFGYNLGKFIYLVDALDDLENDIKKKSYNPFFEKYGGNYEKMISAAEFTLTFTLSRLAEEFEKIKFYKNTEIIKNIVYLGLRSKLDSVLNRYKKTSPSERKKPQ